MKLSGIDRDFQVTGAGKIERDPETSEPTGILRSAMRYLKVPPDEIKATPAQRDERLVKLFEDYLSVGITSIIDRDANAEEVEQYRRLHAAKKLTLRVRFSQNVDTSVATRKIIEQIDRIAADPVRQDDDWLRRIGIKTYVRVPIVRATVERGLQFTAHSVGDGAVHELLSAYEEVNQTTLIAATRPCLTHSNFMSREAIELAARLGVMIDIQPAWLYLDTRTLVAQFGDERLRWFQPLRSLFEAGVTAGGGSDHMQKIGSLRSINPYNPFLGMWVTITRRAKWYDKPLHPEESLSRQQAIRFYTINNARLMFLDEQIGSLEPGKLADLVVLDRDLLTCPIDDLREAQVLATYVDGRLAYERGDQQR